MTNDINNGSKTLDLEGKVSMIVGLAGQETIKYMQHKKSKCLDHNFFYSGDEQSNRVIHINPSHSKESSVPSLQVTSKTPGARIPSSHVGLSHHVNGDDGD